ncbi:MAG TPA: hypothetical protein VH062_05410, partial [Polyangiaceae bacterium]|nr:hypothetical protein [Polyangiaceae bacterium]
ADSVRTADERSAGHRSYSDISVSGVPGEVSSLTPTSGVMMPARVMDFGTDPRGAPVTPYDAMMPARRSRSGKGMLVGLALTVAFGGGAYIGLGNLGVFDSAPAPYAAARPSAKPVEPVRAPAPAVTPSAEPVVETAPLPTSKPVHHAGASHVIAHTSSTSASNTATVSATTTSVASKPVTHATTGKAGAKSGFVPPPMSDPGF